jgi:hypothetical protein
MFDFDSIDQWGPSLLNYLSATVPETAYAFLRDRRPKYFEECRDLLFRAPGVSPREIIAATGDWLRSQPVVAYHGSRLTSEEIRMIQSEGLRPLEARGRIARLGLILARHPNWSNISGCLGEVVDAFGVHGLAKGHGMREGLVHATISRAGLIHRFNRYLMYGSEFDQVVAQTLVGEYGLRLLADYGQPAVIKLCIPGAIALKAANPNPQLSEKMPYPIGDILYSWARWTIDRKFSSADVGVDCGLRFDVLIPPGWIVGHEIVDDSTMVVK